MAMDFFEHQDRARRSSARLVMLFIAAVIATVVLVHLAVGTIWIVTEAKMRSEESGAIASPEFSRLLDWRLMAIVGGSTVLVILLGSGAKLAQLSAGGRVVAEHLGGRRIHPDTSDPSERRVLNVVEEMAIASGLPMPPVYLMAGEQGINAFAAGFGPGDAVIGVTRGSIDRLSRDELQGVMAHEFSHILNGDMRLNLRLMGVLHGILIISMLGHGLMRVAFYSGAAHSGRRDKNAGMPILALGLALMVIGYVGWFFGTWIKSAVSRQREFLADASAVQFTRNPSGIAGALKRILSHSKRALLAHPNASEASHMYFGAGVRAMFMTHPPLPVRITRIEPSWDGTIPERERREPAPEQGTPGAGLAQKRRAMIDLLGVAAAEAAMQGKQTAPPSGLPQIGVIGHAHIEHARELIERIPDDLRGASSEPYGARAVMYALLISTDPVIRKGQLEHLHRHADSGVAELTAQLVPAAVAMDREVRLPLVDLAIGTLRGLSESQYRVFKSNLVELVRADRRIDMFEWSLGRILLRHLELEFTRAEPARAQPASPAELQQHGAVLLSALARAGHPDPQRAAHAFRVGSRSLGLGEGELLSPEESGLDDLDRALDRLASVVPTTKRRVIEACAVCVVADREIRPAEAELLRAIADSLGVPIPPLLPGQQLVEGRSD